MGRTSAARPGMRCSDSASSAVSFSSAGTTDATRARPRTVPHRAVEQRAGVLQTQEMRHGEAHGCPRGDPPEEVAPRGPVDQHVVAVAADADGEGDRSAVAHDREGGREGSVEDLVQCRPVGHLVLRQAAHPGERGEGEVGHVSITVAQADHRIGRFSRFRVDQCQAGAMISSGILDRSSSVPLHVQLTHGLRSAIVDGRWVPGEALPSTRALADDLGVARGTVVAAYETLAGEGYLVARPGGRTTVAALPLGPAAPAGAPVPPRSPGAVAIDLRPGGPVRAVSPTPRGDPLGGGRAPAIPSRTSTTRTDCPRCARRSPDTSDAPADCRWTPPT